MTFAIFFYIWMVKFTIFFSMIYWLMSQFFTSNWQKLKTFSAIDWHSCCSFFRQIDKNWDFFSVSDWRLLQLFLHMTLEIPYFFSDRLTKFPWKIDKNCNFLLQWVIADTWYFYYYFFFAYDWQNLHFLLSWANGENRDFFSVSNWNLTVLSRTDLQKVRFFLQCLAKWWTPIKFKVKVG